MDEITRKRLKRAGPSRSWTPRDALECALLEITEGTEKANRCLILLIHDEGNDEDGMTLVPYRSNITRSMEVSYLELHKAIMIDKWRGNDE